jgi:hypothetical protein
VSREDADRGTIALCVQCELAAAAAAAGSHVPS